MRKSYILFFIFLFAISGCTDKAKTSELENKIADIDVRLKKLEEARDKKADSTKTVDGIIQAMGELKSIGSAIEVYITDVFDSPKVETFKELKKILVPKYMKKCPDLDPWGNEYIYKRTESTAYYVASSGSDGKFDGYKEGRYYNLAGKDVIYANGEFVFYPETD